MSIRFQRDGVVFSGRNLPSYTLDSNSGSIYQRKLNLSHELTHTITPSELSHKPTFLDEGLTVLLSEEYTGCDSNPPKNYPKAKKLVLELLTIDKDIIKSIRRKYPDKKISDISKDELIGINPGIPISLAQELTNPFIY